MISSPQSFDPVRRPEEATKRRQHVLARMVLEGYITQAEADAAAPAPLPTTVAKDIPQPTRPLHGGGAPPAVRRHPPRRHARRARGDDLPGRHQGPHDARSGDAGDRRAGRPRAPAGEPVHGVARRHRSRRRRGEGPRRRAELRRGQVQPGDARCASGGVVVQDDRPGGVARLRSLARGPRRRHGPVLVPDAGVRSAGVERRQLRRRQRRGARDDAAGGDGEVVELRVRPARPHPRPRQDRRDGEEARPVATAAERAVDRARLGRGLAARDGVRVRHARRRRHPAPAGVHPSRRGTGRQGAAARTTPPRNASSSRRSPAPSPTCCAASSSAAPAARAAIGRPAGGQDGDGAGVAGRVVRRVHAAAGSGGVDGIAEGPGEHDRRRPARTSPAGRSRR